VLQTIADPAAVVALFATKTRFDTGSWFGKRRVWLAFAGDSMIFIARGPRPLAQQVPLATLRDAQYNAVTGEVVFATPQVPVQAVVLSPLSAAQLLAQLRKE